jgi:glutamate dehydrogenase
MADLPGVEQDEIARRLIGDAADVLAGLDSDVPREFITSFFDRTAPEDLVRYEPRDIAELARSAWRFFSTRAAGQSKLRLEPAPGGADRIRLRDAAVLEIVNDDMPFLVDSVMAELAEQGVDIRFVAHPVFAVERDGGGRIVAFSGAQTAATGRSRESFIHIHLERMENAGRRADVVTALQHTLADVRICVSDWRPMMEQMRCRLTRLTCRPRSLPRASASWNG